MKIRTLVARMAMGRGASGARRPKGLGAIDVRFVLPGVQLSGSPAMGERADEEVALDEAGYPWLVRRGGRLSDARVCGCLAGVALLDVAVMGGNLVSYGEPEAELLDGDDSPEAADGG